MGEPIYYCPGCGKVGQSSADLLRQGCEGKHLEYVPAHERDRWRDAATKGYSERRRYREALERIEAKAGPGGTVWNLARQALSGGDEDE